KHNFKQYVMYGIYRIIKSKLDVTLKLGSREQSLNCADRDPMPGPSRTTCKGQGCRAVSVQNQYSCQSGSLRLIDADAATQLFLRTRFPGSSVNHPPSLWGGHVSEEADCRFDAPAPNWW